MPRVYMQTGHVNIIHIHIRNSKGGGGGVRGLNASDAMTVAYIKKMGNIAMEEPNEM